MTVPTTTSAVSYTGTGSTSAFQYTWRIAASADLIVYTLSADGLTLTLLTETADYTVAGAGVFTGGTVTLVAGNLATGVTLFIASDPAELQQLLLQQGAAFNPGDLMNQLDLTVRMIQAMRRLVGNSIQFPVAESLLGLNAVLPVLNSRKSTILGFDSNGALALQASPGFAANALAGMVKGPVLTGTYVILGRSVKPFTINTLNTHVSTGTGNISITVNGTPVTGLSSVGISTSRTTLTATDLNSVAIGDIVRLVIGTASVDLADFDWTLGITE